MKLIDVDTRLDADKILYALLRERPLEANISHRHMPTFDEHKRYVISNPYYVWYLIEDDSEIVGSVYLTDRDEIGIFVFRRHHRKSYARHAVAELMKEHPRDRYLANINPSNEPSIFLFAGLGFEHLQNTYEFYP